MEKLEINKDTINTIFWKVLKEQLMKKKKIWNFLFAFPNKKPRHMKPENVLKEIMCPPIYYESIPH